MSVSCRKTPIVGYSGFVPGYTSECQNYGKVWRDVVVNNEARKVNGVKVRVCRWTYLCCEEEAEPKASF